MNELIHVHLIPAMNLGGFCKNGAVGNCNGLGWVLLLAHVSEVYRRVLGEQFALCLRECCWTDDRLWFMFVFRMRFYFVDVKVHSFIHISE